MSARPGGQLCKGGLLRKAAITSYCALSLRPDPQRGLDPFTADLTDALQLIGAQGIRELHQDAILAKHRLLHDPADLYF